MITKILDVLSFNQCPLKQSQNPLPGLDECHQVDFTPLFACLQPIGKFANHGIDNLIQ